MALINFGPIPRGVMDHYSRTDDWFLRTVLQVIEIWSKDKQPCYVTLRTDLSSSSFMFLSEKNDRARLGLPSKLHPLNSDHACMQLLLLFGVQLLFK